jgi:hypothetical protein
MPDTIGRITVSTVTNSGQTFPLTTQHPFGFSVERPVTVPYEQNTQQSPGFGRSIARHVVHS